MKKSIKNAIFIILLLTLSISTAILAYLQFFASDEEELSGEWTTNLDMTEHAVVTALDWLQDIEAVSVSLEDMESYMNGLTIQVNLAMEQTGHGEGTFKCNVSPESYEVCNQAAYEAFATAFQELLAERLHMAGYTGSIDKEAIEALVTETFGMSTVSYLMDYGPGLLPSLEDLQAEYDGSGTYKTEEDILTREFDAGGGVTTKAEYYIRKDSTLILTGESGAVPDDSISDYYPIIYEQQMPSSASPTYVNND